LEFIPVDNNGSFEDLYKQIDEILDTDYSQTLALIQMEYT